MKNLEKLLLISSSIAIVKQIKIMRRLIYILPIIFQVIFFYNACAYADTCIDCHTNPKYKKEDIAKLKKCLTCHGMAGHPYKDTAPKKGIISTAEAAEKEIIPDLKDMVLTPAGEFIMGSDDRLRDEKPLHAVYIRAFYIDRFEVTNEDFRKFIYASGYHAPDNWEYGRYPS